MNIEVGGSNPSQIINTDVSRVSKDFVNRVRKWSMLDTFLTTKTTNLLKKIEKEVVFFYVVEICNSRF
jgi:hypothetical protein